MRALLPPAETVDLPAAYALPPGRSVRANFVAAADGAAELDGVSGGLGGDADREVFRALRRMTDVVLVGSGTVRAENYGPAKIPAAVREARTAEGRPAVPPIAVVSKRLDLPADHRLFVEEGPRPVLLTVGAAPAERRSALAEVADLVDVGDEELELAVALDALAALGLERVLCEGGPSLFATLAAAGLVDELDLTLAPVLGGPGHPGITGSGPAWAASVGLRLAQVLEDAGTLFLRYLRA